jgi:alkylated DNA nucleotide flippase Atl1
MRARRHGTAAAHGRGSPAAGPQAGSPPRSRFAMAVLRCVAEIPPGRVLSYGDVAHIVGGGTARGVGQVLSHDGLAVPWHHVVRADGSAAHFTAPRPTPR